jgi:hypothetical protein
LGFLIALPVALSALAPAGFANPAQSESAAPQTSSTLPSLTGLQPGTKILAALQTTLDVLATKSGDEIAARVTKNLKRGGRIIVHEGDQLVGRVTSVQPQNVRKAQEGSEVAIAFDRLKSGASTYRLNTVIHSVVRIAGQLRGEAAGTKETQLTAKPNKGPRGQHPAPSSGRRALSSGDGEGRAGEETASSGGDRRGGAAPPDSIKARSRPAPDGRTGAVSVLTERQGNLRLRAGTCLDFRTQGQ